MLDHLLSDWLDFGVNSNDRVHTHMMKMVQSAQHELIIYDDGDGATENIYGDSGAEFIATLVDKCKLNENFRVRILFNCFNADLAISKVVRQQSSLPNLEIRYRNGDRPNDYHFKISDGGLLYYLSNHGQGEQERKFKFIASKNKYFVAKYVREFAEQFEQDFGLALSFDEASRQQQA